jgi:hypothetical protein
MTAVRRIAKRVLPGSVVNWIRKARSRTMRDSPLSMSGGVNANTSGLAVGYLISLETKLFATGDQSYARRLATAISASSKGSEAHTRGTLALARWYLHAGSPGEALRHLDEARPSDDGLRMAVDMCRVDCLFEVRDGQAALAILSKVIGRHANEQNVVLRVGQARSLLEESVHHGSGSMAEALNTIYRGAGFGMIRRTLVIGRIGLDNISCDVPRAEPEGGLPRVTVVIEIPDGSTDMVGLSSLVRQSWRNLELVVVAGDQVRDHISAFDFTLLRDEGVILVDEPTNGDHPLTQGLRHGTGELIMTHPHGTWSHPQRIEAQASALIANPDLRGTISSHMYVGDCLVPRPLGIVPQEDLVGPNPDSLMIRISGSPLDELLAEFDRVRSNHSPVTGTVSLFEGVDLVNHGVPLALTRKDLPTARSARGVPS